MFLTSKQNAKRQKKQKKSACVRVKEIWERLKSSLKSFQSFPVMLSQNCFSDHCVTGFVNPTCPKSGASIKRSIAKNSTYSRRPPSAFDLRVLLRGWRRRSCGRGRVIPGFNRVRITDHRVPRRGSLRTWGPIWPETSSCMRVNRIRMLLGLYWLSVHVSLAPPLVLAIDPIVSVPVVPVHLIVRRSWPATWK